MRTLDTANFSNKKVLIRVDFNVPLDENKRVTDHTRIKAAKPTIDKVLAEGGSCVLMTHLGRPKGVDDKLSLRHIVSETQKVLGVDVQFSKDTIGPGAEAKAQALQPGQVMLLENLRFYDEETKGDEQFANALSTLADCYINDAFGTAHRAHASTTIVAQFFPKAKYFGYLLAQEIDAIDRVMSTGEKPVLAVLGGAKVSSKITIIENILDKVDHLIIGGGMSFTFAKAMGGQIGNSICEDDKQELALSILSSAKEKGVQIHLPTDVVAGDQFSNEANQQIFPIDQIPDGWEGMDAGPESLAAFREVVLKSRTILWNGPLGVFEFSRFSQGTIALGEAISASTKNGAFSLVGGGDSVAAVKQFNMENEVSYVSTGGGAMLESLEGKTLPGIAAIMA
ncbi:MAG: phosphoglycerate kinase [Flavobacteriaceae bacterium]|nr:phosphoglycerate kinase [Flavobacteriaceae bacterium]|tara:strand:- start:163 stop:1350 length:1188 start_codon:yes stop_codon:yes gene_type:complete